MSTGPDLVGTLGISSLRRRYRAGLSPVTVMAAVLDRIDARGPDGVWISRVDRDQVLAAAAALDAAKIDQLPLYGIPFGLKDNIDVARMRTTAACPGFAYDADSTALLVRKLLDAGAVLVGKTNLDQFATGLNGTRSPYGIPESVFGPDLGERLIAGGSSSGSAVAVAAGLVSFAIGTDTAGSGRVPAALNNIVGVKPSIGLVSTNGVVPACRSLDCPSVFSLTVADGSHVLAVIAGPDPTDPLSRVRRGAGPADLPRAPVGLRYAVPAEITGWGERGEETAWSRFCARLEAAGATLVPLDFADFAEAGHQLYGGAWLAERYEVIRPTLSEDPEKVLPVLRELLAPAAAITAADTFAAVIRMSELQRRTDAALAGFDALLTPTCTTTFTVAEMLADPVALNSRLGTFTTFTNLLDLCALSVPTGLTQAGAPFGISLHAPAGRDAALAAQGGVIETLVSGVAGAPVLT